MFIIVDFVHFERDGVDDVVMFFDLFELLLDLVCGIAAAFEAHPRHDFAGGASQAGSRRQEDNKEMWSVRLHH